MAVAPAPTTNPLAPLSAQQITSQATKTIGAAYAPQYQDLNQQTTLAEGVAAKRTADNKYYQTWLDTQTQALQAHADAADQALGDANTKLYNDQANLYAGQQGALVAGANARMGNVSNNANSAAFGTDLQNAQQQNMGLLMNAEHQGASTVDTAKGEVGAAIANTGNAMSQIRSKQMTDLDTALTGIANMRSKLNTAKTGDIAKEITRLQGVEISKAQSNRDFNAVAQKLNLATLNTASLINTRATNAATAQQNAATALTRAQQSQMNSDRNYNLNKSKYDAATAKDLYEREHGLGPYRVAKGRSGAAGTTGPKPLTQTSQNSIYNHVDRITGEIEMLINQHNMTPEQAYHVVAQGGQYIASYSTNAQGVKVPHYARITANPYGTQILNAAYNVRSGGPGLSPGDLAALKKMGLANPAKRYGAAYNTSITPGAQASPH